VKRRPSVALSGGSSTRRAGRIGPSTTAAATQVGFVAEPLSKASGAVMAAFEERPMPTQTAA
jgi:hypothetical protein